MSASPYFPFYVNDWLNGTARLTAIQRGVYITLVALMYDENGPIANDPVFLSRQCNMTRAAFDSALARLVELNKIEVSEGRLINKRARKEIEIREETSRKRTEAARSRWEKEQQKQQQQDASASDLHMLTNFNSNSSKDSLSSASPPECEIQKPKQTDLFPDAEIDRLFAVFREVFPKRKGDSGVKVGKAKLKAALKSGVPFDEIMIAARRYKSNAVELGREGTQFVAQLPAWFNAAPWMENEAHSATAPPAPSKPKEIGWRDHVQTFRKSSGMDWRGQGPAPDEPGCRAPREILEEFGFFPKQLAPLALVHSA